MTKSGDPGHESPGSTVTSPEGASSLSSSPTLPFSRRYAPVQLARSEAPPGRSEVGRAAPSASLPFEEVYERYFEFVWRSLRMLGVARASLDDAVQDVFGVVSRQLPRFEGRSSLRTWVFGIAQYTAANHRRGERRKGAPLSPLQDDLESREPGPQQQAEASQLANAIQSFCAELEESRRSVFVLGLLEEVPPAEIAELLAIPVNTVYSRLRALRQALKERLEQREAAQ
jgi:RNA polymerase sigma-70 factor (ECF subfamily)